MLFKISNFINMANYSYNLRRNYGSHGILYADSRRSKNKRPKWPFGVLMLLILAGIIVLSICYFNNIKISSFLRKPAKRGANTSASSQNSEKDIPAVSNEGATPTLRDPGQFYGQQIPSKVTSTQSGRDTTFEDNYRRAYLDFSNGNYTDARNTLRGLLDTITPQDSVYTKATQLLNSISKMLYESGTDPELSSVYKVVSGDTLSAIAKKYGTTVATIQKTNGMTDTKLKINQELKIVRVSWNVEIRRSSSELVILSNGKLFRFYKIYPGTYIPDSLSGEYKIVDKNPSPEWKVNGQTFAYDSPDNICGARLLALNPVNRTTDSHSTAIHGSNTLGSPDPSRGTPGYFRMSNDDVKEIYDLLPIGTRVNIISQ